MEMVTSYVATGEGLGVNLAIADAIAEQAEVAATPPEDGAPPTPGADSEAPERLRLAAEHVVSAQLEMQTAGLGLDDPQAPLAPVVSELHLTP